MIPLLALFRSSGSDGIAVAVIGAFAGVYVFYRGFRLLQRKRLILNTPASKIRSAALGLVEINGLAVGPYTLTAPITGLPCFYFHSTAWQWQQRGRNTQWVKVAEERLHVPFFLDDNTGRVLVDPQGAEMDIHRDFHDEFGTSLFSSSLEIPSNISGFLARHGVSTDKKIKIDEYCIKPKNALFILGTLAQNPGLSVSATPVLSLTAEQTALSLRLPNLSSLSPQTDVSTAGRVLLSAFKGEPTGIHLLSANPPAHISDPAEQQKVTAALMKAGITNPAAWAAAGVVNPAVAVSPASVPTGGGTAAAPALEQFDLHPPVVLMKGAHDPAFLICWHSQRDVVNSLSWKSALMIWGGPALTLLCVYIMAARFDWL
ncbi:MAG: GIDE domain-containing protein [Terriglobales bacterium]